jgi:rhodanese-related sulfurtransferase
MNASSTQAPTAISPASLQRLRALGAPADLLDVRTPPEYAAAHVPGALLVPLDDLNPTEFQGRRSDPAAPLYVLCHTGARARKAIDRFRAQGFEHCVLVEGGTQAWIDAGLPVESATTRVLPLIQQVHLVIGFFTALGAVLALTVDVRLALLPLITGCGLLVNGITGWCGMALLLAKMPWNRRIAPATCTR